jgi:hypothetical protein
MMGIGMNYSVSEMRASVKKNIAACDELCIQINRHVEDIMRISQSNLDMIRKLKNQ